jgi:hypothetical protein
MQVGAGETADHYGTANTTNTTGGNDNDNGNDNGKGPGGRRGRGTTDNGRRTTEATMTTALPIPSMASIAFSPVGRTPPAAANAP